MHCRILILLASLLLLPSEMSLAEDWSRDHAAHLLRRAGFGGTPEQIDFLTELGRPKAVEYIVNYHAVDWRPPEIEVVSTSMPPRLLEPDADPERIEELRVLQRKTDHRQIAAVVNWWIETMTATPRPLEEKLTLFWHGHFTSGQREVRSSRAMYDQNQLLRRHASGNFRTLLIDITHDPAMILYLNTQQNRRNSPNENYARELLELFTLGPGRYTEQDIKEAARALTGIGVDPETGRQVFRPRQHDDGVKRFLGRKGRFGAEEIIDIILVQPRSGEFICAKLWEYFAGQAPPQRVVESLAATFRRSRYELKPVLMEMFNRREFYGEPCRFTRVKSPVELMVGTMRMLEIVPEDTTAISAAMRQMGQQLMQPPSVKGWDGGLAWITTSSLYTRYNAACALISGNDDPQTRRRRDVLRKRLEETFGAEAVLMPDYPLSEPQPAYDPLPVIRSYSLTTPEKVVDHYIGRLLQRPIAPDRRQVLIDALIQDWRNAEISEEQIARAVRGVVQLIVSMPEYQMD